MLREEFDKARKELSNAKGSPATYLGANFSDGDKKKFEDGISAIDKKIESQAAKHKEEEDTQKPWELNMRH